MILEELKATRAADVLKAGVVAARLERDEGGITFTYNPDYSGPDVALTLSRAASGSRWIAGALPPFFSGLLPEGRRLAAIQRATKTSLDDELTLLLAVGEDTVGDVQVVPTGAAPGNTSSLVTPRRLDEADFAEVLEEALGAGAPDRAALAGVQDKVSGHMISLPIAYRGASWILKLDPPEFPHLVANEAFFLGVARDSGIEAAEAHVVRDRTGAQGLLVRRFDRVSTDAGQTTLPQEDGCQVLGRYPADKYRLSTEEVVEGLAACTGAPVVAARDLIRQFAFAYLTCNGDAHAKNVSVQCPDEWRVAPAYDLPSSHVYGDDTMALAINGKTREDIGRRDFFELGARTGVPEKAVARVLDALLASATGWIERLDELPFDERRIHKLRKAVRYRASRLG
jgi:serine/threonine-protein kinase HipA